MSRPSHRLRPTPLGVLRCTYAYLFSIADSRPDPVKNPLLNALLTLSFVIFVNLVTIGMLVTATKSEYTTSFTHIPRTMILAICVGILLMNYVYFARKPTHDGIMAEYAFNDDSRKRCKSIAWTYIVMSFLAAVVVVFATRPKS